VEAGVVPICPKPLTSGAKAGGRFGRQDFVYRPESDTNRCPAGEMLSLQQQRDEIEAGYPAEELGFWAETAKRWAAGLEPERLAYAVRGGAKKQARDVFVFMINGAKRRAPAATMTLQRLVG
jgi:uncharacterized protein YecE (DUF72 family)